MFIKQTLVLLFPCINPGLAKPGYSAFANSVDPDQLASEEANWSGSAHFVIKYVDLYQQSGSRNMTGQKLEVGVASWNGMTIFSH